LTNNKAKEADIALLLRQFTVIITAFILHSHFTTVCLFSPQSVLADETERAQLPHLGNNSNNQTRETKKNLSQPLRFGLAFNSQ
jgi:hypothetical protein